MSIWMMDMMLLDELIFSYFVRVFSIIIKNSMGETTCKAVQVEFVIWKKNNFEL